MLTPSPTINPEDISRSIPIPTYIPDLHSAGPYLFLDSRPNLYGECDLHDDHKRILNEPDGSGQREIIYPEGLCGRVSPNRKWYAYISKWLDDSLNVPNEGIKLHLVNLWGGTTRDIADLLPADFYSRQENMINAFKFEINSTGKDYLEEFISVDFTITSLYESIRNITWSPDSRYVAFPAMIDGDSTDVYVFDVETGTRSRKDNKYLNAFDIQWSPDGKWILFNNLEPYPGAPYSTTSYWAVPMDRPGQIQPIDNDCSSFSWVADIELFGRECHYGCGGDAPVGTDLFRINIGSGEKRSIWKGDWYGYAFDKENGTIILNAEDPCSEEECDSEITGIFFGPIFGFKKRISDARRYGYDFMFRKGSIHRFLGLSNPSNYPFTFVEGITQNGKTETLIKGNNLRISLPADYKWMAITGDDGISLFDEADRLVYQWTDAPVHKAVWATNSQVVFFMTSDAVIKLNTETFSIQKLFDCPTGSCNGDTGLSLILDVYFSSLPNLHAQPPSFENRKAGTSLWSKAAFRDLFEPGIQEYSVNIPAYSTWRWDFSWCAKSQDGLEAILGPLDLQFLIGGEKIGEDIFRMYDFPKGGGFCRTWATMLSGWQPGDVTDLEIRYTLREAINDGTQGYPAGEYRQINHITVAE
jgi:hypothetical protein